MASSSRPVVASVPVVTKLSPVTGKRMFDEDEPLPPDQVFKLKAKALLLGASLASRLQESRKRSKSEGQSSYTVTKGDKLDQLSAPVGKSLKGRSHVRSATPFRTKRDTTKSRSAFVKPLKQSPLVDTVAFTNNDDIETMYECLGRLLPAGSTSGTTGPASTSHPPTAIAPVASASSAQSTAAVHSNNAAAQGQSTKTEHDPPSMSASWEYVPAPTMAAPVNSSVGVGSAASAPTVATSTPGVATTAVTPTPGVAAGVADHPIHAPVDRYLLDAAMHQSGELSDRNALLASHAHYAQGLRDASAVAQRAAESRERVITENAAFALNAAVGNVVSQATSEVQAQRAKYDQEQQALRDALTRHQVAECNTRVNVDLALAQWNQEMGLLKECAVNEVGYYQKELSQAQDRVNDLTEADYNARLQANSTEHEIVVLSRSNEELVSRVQRSAEESHIRGINMLDMSPWEVQVSGPKL